MTDDEDSVRDPEVQLLVEKTRSSSGTTHLNLAQMRRIGKISDDQYEEAIATLENDEEDQTSTARE